MAQTLVSSVAITNLAASASTSVAHGIALESGSVAPQVVLPDRASPLVVTAVTATQITVRNDGSAAASANFLCMYLHSIQMPSTGLASAFTYQGAAGVGGSARYDYYYVDPGATQDAAQKLYTTISAALAAASGSSILINLAPGSANTWDGSNLDSKEVAIIGQGVKSLVTLTMTGASLASTATAKKLTIGNVTLTGTGVTVAANRHIRFENVTASGLRWAWATGANTFEIVESFLTDVNFTKTGASTWTVTIIDSYLDITPWDDGGGDFYCWDAPASDAFTAYNSTFRVLAPNAAITTFMARTNGTFEDCTFDFRGYAGSTFGVFSSSTATLYNCSMTLAEDDGLTYAIDDTASVTAFGCSIYVVFGTTTVAVTDLPAGGFIVNAGMTAIVPT